MKSILLWILAVVITLASALYQRKTGPTYPIDGRAEIAGSIVNFSLQRSYGGEGDQPVILSVSDTAVTGTLVYRRYKTNDPWTNTQMSREGSMLKSFLPHQPPAGKLEYYIILQKSQNMIYIPEGESVVTRFKGAVPIGILILHVFFMFFAMLSSTRTALEALRQRGNLRPYVFWTVGLLFIGGIILGPVVQKYAFGALWTGFPFGTDLTDNKTLIALIVWFVALIAIIRNPKAKLWVIAAAIVLIMTYLIPHSMHGSELDYSKLESSKVEKIIDE